MATMPFTPCSSEPCTDVTVSILQTLFGPVIRNLTTGTDPAGIDPAVNVIAMMMEHFNSGVLTIATLIVSFVTVVGVINTANDGEAFGKNWSTLWTPMRIISGAAVLLPTGTGYSFIQLIVMMLSLWGIGFANGTFEIGVKNGIIGGSLQNVSQQIGMGSAAKANKDFPLYNMREIAADYMSAKYCAKTVNAIYGAGTVEGLAKPNVNLKPGGGPDRSSTEAKVKTTYIYEFKDRNSEAQLAGGSAVCGTVNLYEYEHVAPPDTLLNDVKDMFPSAVFNVKTRNANNEAISLLRDAVLRSKLVAVKAMMQEMDAWVGEWPDNINTDWAGVGGNRFNQIVDRSQGNMLSDLQNRMQRDSTLKILMETYSNDITKDGWAMAGGYYQRLSGIREEMRKIYSESPGKITQPALGQLPDDARGFLVRQSATMPALVLRNAIDSSGYKPKSITDTADIKSILPTTWKDLDIDQIGERGNKLLNSLVGNIIESITNTALGADGNTDAIARIKTTGDILTVANAEIYGYILRVDGGITTIRALAALGSGIPFVSAGSKIVDVVGEFIMRKFVVPLTEILPWLDILAFYFGVFLPSLPYTIFIIAVVGWLLAVLQTVFAAPLWAVMHMSPDRTFVGSQSQGYLMFLALFIRPALIVGALFAAMLLANPILLYVSKAFWSMRTAQVSSAESMGFYVQFLTWKNWLVMYGLLLLPIIYMIFGLTNTLPDAILTFIGAGIRPLGETNAASEMRGGMEKMGAAQAGKAAAALAKKLEDNKKKLEKEKEKDKPAGSPDNEGGKLLSETGSGVGKTSEHTPKETNGSEGQSNPNDAVTATSAGVGQTTGHTPKETNGSEGQSNPNDAVTATGAGGGGGGGSNAAAAAAAANQPVSNTEAVKSASPESAETTGIPTTGASPSAARVPAGSAGSESIVSEDSKTAAAPSENNQLKDDVQKSNGFQENPVKQEFKEKPVDKGNEEKAA